jgi:mannose-1-phosphate guanylyltransferase
MRAERTGGHIFAMIMAGGGGERFWPASRQALPKQLLRIFGRRTMLQETARRISGLVPAQRLVVVTTALQAPLIARQLPRIPRGSIVAEPFGRDTAACIALGAAIVLSRDPEGIMVVLPADHVIRDRQRLLLALRDACRFARERECLVTLGIVPTEPATGYGYIRRGAAVSRGMRTVFSKVRAFTEKPDRAAARRYLRSGDYYWNSGIFVWKASVIAEEFKRHMPALHRGLLEIRDALGTRRAAAVIRRVYERIERISIDYGVMERSDRTVVARADFDWDDAGSWCALERHFPADRAGNVILGRSVALDTERCIIVSDDGIVGCLGVKDLVVVKTADAVLVCRRGAAQDLKRIVRELKAGAGMRRFA